MHGIPLFPPWDIDGQPCLSLEGKTPKTDDSAPSDPKSARQAAPSATISGADDPQDAPEAPGPCKAVLVIPKGKPSPIDQVKATRKTTIEIEYDDLGDGVKRVRCEGCTPAAGFRVGPHHWAALWAPCITRGEIQP